MPFTDLLHRSEAPRLAPFLALSALLHALVIAAVPLLDRPGDETVATLRLALAHPAASPARPAANEKSPRVARDRAMAKRPATPRPVDAPREATVAKTERAAEGAAASATEEAPSHDMAQASARVLAQVRTAVARYFSYPLLARRHGWQGEVLLGFSVTAEGRIDEVKVVRSSGHRMLDEAARDSLARVGSLPDYVAPNGAPLHLRLPVIYRLAEG